MKLVLIIIILVILVIININKIIYLRKRIDRSKSVIDVYLKKRFDLIPNLVEVVKGYANYETKTLEEITALRTTFNNSLDNASLTKLNEHYKNLIGIIENYPALKASAEFLNLQKSLSKVENEISAVRRIYINDITSYNTKIESFPSSVIASIFNYPKYEIPPLEYEEVKLNF